MKTVICPLRYIFFRIVLILACSTIKSLISFNTAGTEHDDTPFVQPHWHIRLAVLHFVNHNAHYVIKPGPRFPTCGGGSDSYGPKILNVYECAATYSFSFFTPDRPIFWSLLFRPPHIGWGPGLENTELSFKVMGMVSGSKDLSSSNWSSVLIIKLFGVTDVSHDQDNGVFFPLQEYHSWFQMVCLPYNEKYMLFRKMVGNCQS